MRQIKIIIEKNKDGYWAFSNEEESITGGGDTAQGCKQDVLDCIETLKTFDDENRPAFLKEPYELMFKFDTISLLEYYKGVFTNAAFERMTGINQKQIQHYASGHRVPRIEKRKKIESALHQLGKELLAVEL